MSHEIDQNAKHPNILALKLAYLQSNLYASFEFNNDQNDYYCRKTGVKYIVWNVKCLACHRRLKGRTVTVAEIIFFISLDLKAFIDPCVFLTFHRYICVCFPRFLMHDGARAHR